MFYYDGGNRKQQDQQLHQQQATEPASHYQPSITTFAIRGLMPVIYFKFISQLDDSEYQKTRDCPCLQLITICQSCLPSSVFQKSGVQLTLLWDVCYVPLS
jgi:hypothetical protein